MLNSIMHDAQFDHAWCLIPSCMMLNPTLHCNMPDAILLYSLIHSVWCSIPSCTMLNSIMHDAKFYHAWCSIQSCLLSNSIMHDAKSNSTLQPARCYQLYSLIHFAWCSILLCMMLNSIFPGVFSNRTIKSIHLRKCEWPLDPGIWTLRMHGSSADRRWFFKNHFYLQKFKTSSFDSLWSSRR